MFLGLTDTYFRLDGGAMFGIVPKTIWSVFYPADEFNRIRFSCTAFLIVGKGVVLMVEGGIGEVFLGDPKIEALYAIEQSNHLDDELLAAGFRPEDVTHATYSHLHSRPRRNRLPYRRWRVCSSFSQRTLHRAERRMGSGSFKESFQPSELHPRIAHASCTAAFTC